MLVPYQTLSNNSKVWVYQCGRAFTQQEIPLLKEKIENFISTWQRHGVGLKASYLIKYEQFIVLLVDDEISGCAIDASVNLIKTLETEFSVDLMNKLNVAYKSENEINTVSLANFKLAMQQQKITENTVVFNNMVTTKIAFETQWEIPVKNSWHQRFL